MLECEHSSTVSQRKCDADDNKLHKQFANFSLANNRIKMRSADEDVQPSFQAPAPSLWKGMSESIKPDPLLAITPEKPLSMTKSYRNPLLLTKVSSNDSKCVSGKNPLVHGFLVRNDARKGKQRVHFAPDTRTSPPSNNIAESNESGDGNDHSDSSESVPQNFSSVKDKLYQPGCYMDIDCKRDFSNMDTQTKEDIVNKRYESGENGPVSDEYLDYFKKHNSHLNQDKSIVAKVIKHKPSLYSNSTFDLVNTAPDSEVRHLPINIEEKTDRTRFAKTKHHSTSPQENHITSYFSQSKSIPYFLDRTSPVSSRNSSASDVPSDNFSDTNRKLDAVHGGQHFVISPANERPQIPVNVLRETQNSSPSQDYVFPFKEYHEQDSYSSTQHPLARPEFNSVLKLSEDLKIAKLKTTDTWGAITKKLKDSEKTRTEIQEKVIVINCIVCINVLYCACI